MLFHTIISTFIGLLVVTACLGSTAINYAHSISKDRELIQALGCSIHYSGALVLRAIVVELWTFPALPNLECRINMIIATLFVI